MCEQYKDYYQQLANTLCGEQDESYILELLASSVPENFGPDVIFFTYLLGDVFELVIYDEQLYLLSYDKVSYELSMSKISKDYILAKIEYLNRLANTLYEFDSTSVDKTLRLIKIRDIYQGFLIGLV